MKVNRRIDAEAPSLSRAAARRRSTPCAPPATGPSCCASGWRVRFPDDVGLLNRAPALERLRDGRAAADVALRLCFLESDEPAAAVQRLLRRRAARATWSRRASCAGAARGCEARLRVDVHERLALVADRRFAATDQGALGLPRGDMVYPPGSDSVLLAEAVPVRSGRARARPLHRQRHPGAAGGAARRRGGRRRHRRARRRDGARQRGG